MSRFTGSINGNPRSRRVQIGDPVSARTFQTSRMSKSRARAMFHRGTSLTKVRQRAPRSLTIARASR